MNIFGKVGTVVQTILLITLSLPAWATEDFDKVIVSGEYKEAIGETETLVCSLQVSNLFTQKTRVYRYEQAKTFGFQMARELIIINLDTDTVYHARADLNFLDIEDSDQTIVPSMNMNEFNAANLPYTWVLIDWIENIYSKSGRYLELYLQDAPWNPGPLDRLQNGYSISAVTYDLGDGEGGSRRLKGKIGSEVLLPFVMRNSTTQPDLSEELILPFSYEDKLISRDENLLVEVTCE